MYGDIEYCSIIKNKVTGESKGLGYVRYLKPSQAAQAIENCDRSKNGLLKFYFMCLVVVPTCTSVRRMGAAPAEARGTSDLELELQMGVTRHVGIGNRTQVLCKSHKCL